MSMPSGFIRLALKKFLMFSSHLLRDVWVLIKAPCNLFCLIHATSRTRKGNKNKNSKNQKYKTSGLRGVDHMAVRWTQPLRNMSIVKMHELKP